MTCRREGSCPRLSCPQRDQIKVPGECCKYCRGERNTSLYPTLNEEAIIVQLIYVNELAALRVLRPGINVIISGGSFNCPLPVSPWMTHGRAHCLLIIAKSPTLLFSMKVCTIYAFDEHVRKREAECDINCSTLVSLTRPTMCLCQRCQLHVPMISGFLASVLIVAAGCVFLFGKVDVGYVCCSTFLSPNREHICLVSTVSWGMAVIYFSVWVNGKHTCSSSSDWDGEPTFPRSIVLSSPVFDHSTQSVIADI